MLIISMILLGYHSNQLKTTYSPVHTQATSAGPVLAYAKMLSPL